MVDYDRVDSRYHYNMVCYGSGPCIWTPRVCKIVAFRGVFFKILGHCCMYLWGPSGYSEGQGAELR